MPICFFWGCNSRKDRHPYITFHRIPPKQLELYYNLARRQDIDRHSFLTSQAYKYRVCSRHFKPEDFELNYMLCHRTVKPGAIPTQQPISHEAAISQAPPDWSQSEQQQQSRATATTTTTPFASTTIVTTTTRAAQKPRTSASSTATSSIASAAAGTSLLLVPRQIHQRTSVRSEASFAPTVDLLDVPTKPPPHFPTVTKRPHSADPKPQLALKQLLLNTGERLPTNVDTSVKKLLEPKMASTPESTPQKTCSSQTMMSLLVQPIPLVMSSASITTTTTTTVSSTTTCSTSAVRLTPITSAVEVHDEVIDDRPFEDYDTCEFPAEDEDVDPEDMNFSLDASMTAYHSGMVVSSDNEDEENMIEQINPSKTRKHIVYQSELVGLFAKLRCDCGSAYEAPKLSESKGSLLLVKSRCRCCSRSFEWRSQPKLGQKSKGNVELAATMFLTGQTFGAISKWLKFCDVQFIGKTSYHNYQHHYVLPPITDHYKLSLQTVRDEVNERCKHTKEPVRLAGDGRYDSPGHNARYCTYSFLDSASGRVAHCTTLETAKCSSAVMAEKDAFVQLLQDAKDEFVLESVTTDGNLSIRAYMQKEEINQVIHGLDVWHICKNLAKNLSNKCKTKQQKKLLPWISHLVNHVWWSTANCAKNDQILKELVFSMTFHIINQHSDFYGMTEIKRCFHEPITSEEHDSLPYLEPGDPAHQVLMEHLHSEHFLKQLSMTTHGQHTGKLENFHSMLLTYVSKRIDFDPASYTGRIQLAVIDHNENAHRECLKESDGTPKLRLRWSKAAKDYRWFKIYPPKTYTFRETILADIIRRAAQPQPPEPEVGRYTGVRISKGREKPQDLQKSKADYLKYKRF